MSPTDANDPRQIALFSRTGSTLNRAKPDLVAPGTRSYGASTTAANPCGSGCNENITNALPGQPHYQWAPGTSFSTPVVTGAAALVREWIHSTPAFNIPDPSPALTKATLLTATKNLAPCNPTCTNPPPGYTCTTCSYCGTMLSQARSTSGLGRSRTELSFSGRPPTISSVNSRHHLPQTGSPGPRLFPLSTTPCPSRLRSSGLMRLRSRIFRIRLQRS